ncbi:MULTISPECIES: TrmB family transcriptional regulator [Natrialbaceae]|uniref:TrmB family transcriptional regulator n=1 Tax=Natrialbaceae TaxID=1644061 RepID=UPI00207D286E|nr:TrmB family transcriptional regulator [Natronococcus sp. CG52]
MDRTTLRAGLMDAGLTQYEADAYLALLERGKAPAVRIAEDTAIPKSRVYDVLRDLEEEGYVETYEQDSLHARARDPSDVLTELQQRAERLLQTADEIEDRWEQPGLDDHKITIVKRFESVLDQFREVAGAADNQIQLAASPGQIEEIRPVLRDAIDRDVFVKLCVTTGPGDEHLVEEMEFADIATEVRHRHLPAPFTALIDRRWTCFSSQTRVNDRYGILVDDLTLTYVFHWYFQSALWVTWELVYADSTNGSKREYVNVRECICDVAPLVTDGVEIPVTVRGFDVRSGDDVTLSGRIVDIISAGTPTRDDGSLTLTHLAGQATLVVESDGTEYGIGGRGATLEDIEATRIVTETTRVAERTD